jgi:hypothetical protein
MVTLSPLYRLTLPANSGLRSPKLSSASVRAHVGKCLWVPCWSNALSGHIGRPVALGLLDWRLRESANVNEKGQAMGTQIIKNGMALGAAGAIVIAVASQSWAAPVALNVAAIKTTESSGVTSVRYYGRSYCCRSRVHPYWANTYYYPYRHSTSYPSPYIYSYNPFSFPVPYPRPYLYPFGYGWGAW